MGGEPYIYIYIYICSHLISPCCSTCWSVVFRFSISSPGDFISFPHLFDHFIKGLISFPKLVDQFIKKMLPTYLFIYHLVSSAVPSFPNLFLQLVITVFLQFSKVFPTCWCMLSFDFISFSHPFWENMERSTIFHGKIWKDPQCFMGKYGKIHHFPWENMEIFTIFHGNIWKDPPFFMGKYGKIHHFSWETVSLARVCRVCRVCWWH